MIGKLALIAIFCLSLAQVQGNELEEAIKNGITKVSGLYDEGQRKVSVSIEVVGYKKKAVEAKTLAFIFKSSVVQQGTKKAVREVAKDMEEKAQALNKTEALECIRKTEKKANQQIDNLTEQFKVNINKLQNATFAKIDTEAKPLAALQGALKLQYQKVVKTIQACKTTSCVDSAVSGCAKWLEEMKAEIGRILGKIGSAVNTHGRDSGDLFKTYITQVNQIKSDGIRDIKKCVFG